MQIDDIYGDLIKIVSHFGVDISSIEIEAFFEEIASNTSSSKEEFLEFVRNNMPNWFKCINGYPRWVQSSDWQFSNGKPMVFVGQIDIPASKGTFHDDSSFYIFWESDTGYTKTIIQVA